jgi:hypothetical protein
MATIYLNWKGPQGRETVDEFTRDPAQTPKEFRAYVREMVSNYHDSKIAVYPSSRHCSNWSAAR